MKQSPVVDGKTTPGHGGRASPNRTPSTCRANREPRDRGSRTVFTLSWQTAPNVWPHRQTGFHRMARACFTFDFPAVTGASGRPGPTLGRPRDQRTLDVVIAWARETRLPGGVARGWASRWGASIVLRHAGADRRSRRGWCPVKRFPGRVVTTGANRIPCVGCALRGWKHRIGRFRPPGAGLKNPDQARRGWKLNPGPAGRGGRRRSRRFPAC